jgi:hypothetical protein
MGLSDTGFRGKGAGSEKSLGDASFDRKLG